MGAFVYMLRCIDGSQYAGNTRSRDLGRRIAEHQAGAYHGSTSTRRPVHLAGPEYFDRITDAIAAERKIKGWSRAAKPALISAGWTKIERLARRRAGMPKSSSRGAGETSLEG